MEDETVCNREKEKKKSLEREKFRDIVISMGLTQFQVFTKIHLKTKISIKSFLYLTLKIVIQILVQNMLFFSNNFRCLNVKNFCLELFIQSLTFVFYPLFYFFDQIYFTIFLFCLLFNLIIYNITMNCNDFYQNYKMYLK